MEDERFKDAIEKAGEQVHKNYQSDVIIYKTKGEDVIGKEPKLVKVAEDSIQMNKPLKFTNYTLYQSGYQEDELTKMTFSLYETDTPNQKSLGGVTIGLNSPHKLYELDNGFKLMVLQYFPDYELEDGGPRSISKYPKNPVFVFNIFPPNSDVGEISFVGMGLNVDPTEENKYELSITDFKTRHVSGITVRRDYTLPLFILGEGILLAAHTNKNWFGLKKDIEKAIEGTNIQMVIDQEKESLGGLIHE